MKHLMLQALINPGEYEKLKNLLHGECSVTYQDRSGVGLHEVFKCSDSVYLVVFLVDDKKLFLDIYDFSGGYKYYLEKIVGVLSPDRLSIHYVEREAY